MTDDASLTLRDLPARSRSLGADALREVLGGCGGSCSKDDDCCPEDSCVPVTPNGGLACR